MDYVKSVGLRAVIVTLVSVVIAALCTSVAQAESLASNPGEAPSGSTSVQKVKSPMMSGESRLGSVLKISPGQWDPSTARVSYQWFRDGKRIVGATSASYRSTKADYGKQVMVIVTASAPGRSNGQHTSRARIIRPKVMRNTERPKISGVGRYGRKLTVSPGKWSTSGVTIHYRWLRNGKAIRGAYGRSYAIRPPDVGRRLSVRVAAVKPYYETRKSVSGRTGSIRHRTDVRRTLSYVVRRDGASGDIDAFAKYAGRTLADPRGWRGAGVAFKRVSRGGNFTLVFAKASRVPAYSSGCSAKYSCRVGRYVIINESRWRGATRTWRSSGKSLRGYQHMVVNHETGHFLGKGHRSCPRPGLLAPVMQQQSKSLQGCKVNPWPKADER